jgi:hypothetical protein
MKLLHIYLLVYFALIVGAAVALWQGGVLARLSPVWVVVCAVIAVALGLAAALTSIRPTRPT